MKKLLSVLIAVIMFAAALSVSASAQQGGISLGSASAAPGQSVQLDVSLSGNPGIIALRVLITYDKTKLRLDSAEDTGLLGTGTALFGNSYSADPYVLMWDDSLSTADYNSDGVIARLTFTVLPGAQSGYSDISVSVDNGSVFNSQLQPVRLTASGGRINIIPSGPQNLIISANDISASAGDTFTVPVNITANPGIIALKLDVDYDTDLLTLIGAEDCGLLGASTSVFGNDFSSVPYSLSWEDGLSTENYTSTGTLCILEFRVKSGVPSGTSAISLSVSNGNAYNAALQNVNTIIRSPSVNISGTGTGRYISLAQVIDWIITKLFNNTLGLIFGVEYPSRFGYK